MTQLDEPTPTARLQADHEAAWTEAARSRFVEELADGRLDHAVYRAYLVQDFAFVNDLVDLLGYAVAKAPTIEAKRPYITFLETLTSEENDYFQRAFDELDVPEADRTDPQIGATTREFADLLARAGAGTYAEVLAVLVPVEAIYLDWATWADEQGGAGDWLYDEWIDLHANPAFEAFVSHMRSELDRQLEAATAEEREAVQDLFGETVDLEIAFFEQAYDLA